MGKKKPARRRSKGAGGKTAKKKPARRRSKGAGGKTAKKKPARRRSKGVGGKTAKKKPAHRRSKGVGGKTARKKKKQKRIKKSSSGGTLITCVYCQGRGVDPFGVPSKLSKCQVCQGRKKNFILEPFGECPACSGTGIYRHHRLSCTVCKGKGQLHRIPGKNRKYGCGPENGEMLDIETGLPCLSAYDLGQIKKGRRK